MAVLERDTLGVREVRLFNAVVRWSEAECQRQQLQVTPENKRKVLGEALALIRFPLMTIEEFAAGKPKAQGGGGRGLQGRRPRAPPGTGVCPSVRVDRKRKDGTSADAVCPLCAPTCPSLCPPCSRACVSAPAMRGPVLPHVLGGWGHGDAVGRS